jgi:WhiB family redox-sensing transcriptional regulator
MPVTVLDEIFAPSDMAWQPLGACWQLYYETAVELWFPPENPGGPKEGKGVAGEKERITAAKKICAGCVVRADCLEYAIRHDCLGIWGGLDTQERRAYVRGRNKFTG